jgi:hypothetical protein
MWPSAFYNKGLMYIEGLENEALEGKFRAKMVKIEGV